MDGDTRYSIGDLARLTGLPVKTIRYYADRGLVPPTDRTPTGYRRFDIDAVARLALVRTLRDLGLDLRTIQRVLARDTSLAEVAAAHAAALEVQIRTLRLRHAVLTAVAKRGTAPEEIELMHRLATLSEAERQRLVGDFLGSVFDGLDAHPEFIGVARSLTPELPANPSMEQVAAWVELAELAQDPDFRTSLREIAVRHATERSPTAVPVRDAAAMVRDSVRPALVAGIAPDSPEAAPIVAAVLTRYARLTGRPNDIELRVALLARLAAVNDPRRERYLDLLSVVNGWSAPESLTPTLDWFHQAATT